MSRGRGRDDAAKAAGAPDGMGFPASEGDAIPAAGGAAVGATGTTAAPESENGADTVGLPGAPRRTDDAAAQVDPMAPHAVAARAVARDRAAGTGPPSRARTRAGRIGGVATGVLLLGAAAVVATGTLAAGAGEQIGREVPVPSAAPPAGDYTAVCAGPPRLLAASADTTDPEFSPLSATARTRVGAMVLSDLSASLTGSALLPLGAGEPLAVLQEFGTDPSPSLDVPASGSEDGLTSRIAGVVRGVKVDAPAVFRAQPQGGLPPVAAATTTYSATDGDLRGLAATRCQVPASESWLVGASTAAGASSVLTLTNPSGTPATVSLQLYGEDGPIDAAGAGEQVVAPGSTRQIVLAALAADQEQVAVRVRSDGGRVAASIQQSVLRGLTPGGVELLSPGAGPNTTQVIPGVVVQDPVLSRSLRQQEGYGTATPAVQVLVPGQGDAVLDVRVFGPDGPVELPGGGEVSAAAGTVTSVPLDALPAGTYTVSVTSDVSVLASARVVRGSKAGEPVDFASAPSGVRLGSGTAVALGDGVDRSLVLGAPSGDATVILTPVDQDGVLGEPITQEVAGGTSVAVPSAGLGASPAAVLVSATGNAVYGAEVLTLPGARAGVSVLGLPAGPAAPQSIPVQLGY